MKTQDTRKTLDREQIKREYAQGHSITNLGRHHGVSPTRIYYVLNEDIAMCHQKLHWAVRKGTIKKEPCAKCGNVKVQAHHEDYTKPLDVVWLCQKHHKELHTCPKPEVKVKMPDRRKKPSSEKWTKHVQILFTSDEYLAIIELANIHFEGNVNRYLRSLILPAIQPAEVVTVTETTAATVAE